MIFSKIAFSNEDQRKDLEDLGRQLAIKCKGLPLAVKTLGSLMHNKTSREHGRIFWIVVYGNYKMLKEVFLHLYF